MRCFCAFTSFLVLSTLASLVPTVGLSDGLFSTFRTNPPSKQFDYYSVEKDARRRIAVVEEYHWGPAETCIAERRYDCAARNLDFVLRWVPNHPHALIRLSWLAVNLGEPEAANSYLDYALKYGAQPSTYIAYGIHLHRVGNYAEAVEKYKSALSINPQHSEAHYNLGLALVALGKYDQARLHARKAYELNYPLPGLKRKLQALGEWNE